VKYCVRAESEDGCCLAGVGRCTKRRKDNRRGVFAPCIRYEQANGLARTKTVHDKYVQRTDDDGTKVLYYETFVDTNKSRTRQGRDTMKSRK